MKKITTIAIIMIFLFNNYYIHIDSSLNEIRSGIPQSMYKNDERNTGFFNFSRTNNSGQLRWFVKINSSTSTSSLVYNTNNIYFLSNHLYSYDIFGNNTIYAEIDEYTTSAPAVDSHGNIYVLTRANSKLYSFSKNGSINWIVPIGGSSEHSILIDNTDKIYFYTLDWPHYEKPAQFYCYNTQGEKIWNIPLKWQAGSSPAISKDNKIYFSCRDTLSSFNYNGSLNWNVSLQNTWFSSPSIDSLNNIYIFNSNGHLYSYDSMGNERWNKTITSLGSQDISPSIDSKGNIYYGSTNGYINALFTNGTSIWEKKLESGNPYSSIIIDLNNNIYFGCDDGSFYCYDSSGFRIWRYDSKYNIRSLPVLDKNNNVYFINDENILYSLGNLPPTKVIIQDINCSKTNINISWNSPENGGSPILGYRVYRNDAIGNFTMYEELGPDQLHFNDTNVINGVNYSYFVVAFNREGDSPPSEIVNGTPFGRSLPPQNIMVELNNQTINITWGLPLDTGGYPVLFYNVYWKESMEMDWSNDTTKSTHYLFEYLIPGIEYRFRISVITEIGESIHSGNYTGYIPLPPSGPLNLTAIAGNKYINLNWDPPDDIGDAENIDRYILYRNDTFYTNIPLDVNEYNDTGLVNGIIYRYRISAVTIAGEGNLSNKVSATPVGLPGKPIGLNYTIQNENDITITWNAPSDTGGMKILSYKVYKYENGELSGENEVFHEEFLDEDVEKGINIEYRVSAVNSMGEGKLSDNLTVFIELGGLPSEPRSLVFDLLDEGVELNWFSPLETGEGPIEGYRIYRKIQNRTDFIVIDEIGPTNEYLDEDIEPNRTYIYKISAYNLVGEGPSSTEKSIFIADDFIPTPANNSSGKNGFPWWLLATIILIVFFALIILMLILRKKKSKPDDSEVDQDDIGLSLEEEIFGVPHPVNNDIMETDPLIPQREE